MNGPAHYRKAEELVAKVDDGAVDWGPLVRSAQVHATLALAAATALQPREFLTVEYRDQVAAPWLEVAG
jgi:hypothetical protein